MVDTHQECQGTDALWQVGHFRGKMRQGEKKVCNAYTCQYRDVGTIASRGLNDIFIMKYNSSRIRQWTRQAGGAGDDKVHCQSWQ